jgi:25S rRNA (cytosine2870-C5)-methyltransferase
MERYQAVVPQWSEVVLASARPEPVTLRVNTQRVEERELRSLLEGRGFRLEGVDGLSGFLRVVEEPYPISMTLEHWSGLFYMQQAVTGVAPLALGARPGERVLDLCAAPGGKASHLAEMMRGKGVLVAGESNEGRIRALLGNLYRLAQPGALVVAADGRSFPGGALFDRVLADVPCS